MITVNNINITEREFDLACNDFMNRTGKQKLSQNEMVAIANQLIDSILLLEEAKNSQLTVSDDEINKYVEGVKSSYKSEEDFNNALKTIGDSIDDFKAKIKDNMILRKYLSTEFYSKVNIQDDEMEKFYKTNEDYFYSQEKLNASHILFNKEDKEAAEKIREELVNGKNFADMAKLYSQCPSKEKGGELGLFTQGQMVPEFEKVAFALKTGEISELVETRFGYHIIKLNSKQDPYKLNYDDVKDTIKKQMVEKEVNEHLKVKINQLRENADITFDQTAMESKIGT
jgi:peptidyl-prolyl cis-trans isomerase C